MTRTPARVPGVLAIVLLGALISGCASSAPERPPAPGASAAARRVVVTLADQGRTLLVTIDTVLEVRLNSTYWTIAPSSAPVVMVGTRAVVTPLRTGPPGMGRGSVVMRFRAIAPGRVRLSASRTTCGEALACSPAQGSFRITVVVS